MPSRRIRILLADLSGPACEQITAVVGREPDIEVVGQTEAGDDIGATAALLDAELVIVGLHGSELPSSVYDLFERRGRLKVIGVSDTVTAAYFHELRPVCAGRSELAGPEEITSAIRFAVGRA